LGEGRSINLTSGTQPDKNAIMLSIRFIIKGQKVLILKVIPFIGALIVYDITDLESWSKVNIWVKELQRYLPAETPIIITGNKCDLPNR
jgi:hypothetical protein